MLSVKPSGFVALYFPVPQQRGILGLSVFGDGQREHNGSAVGSEEKARVVVLCNP
ncbi:hypothetical protein [Yoonia sp.]|uniref:hypothetical protein n=1 Tax=Yoonia sp. TaxID=2212373 RepID=UPI003297EC29